MEVRRFPPNTAGSKMISTIPSFQVGETIKNVKKTILKKADKFETIDYIYLVDKKNILRGIVPIRRLLSCREDGKIDKLMTKKFVAVHPLTHQERVVYLALKYGIKAIPVVDKENRLLGIVPFNTILQIFNMEVREDIFKFGGIFHRVGKEFHTIKSPALTLTKARLLPLLIGLIGGIIAASIVSSFENLLGTYLMLAAFIPVLVYMSDAVGTQSETLIVRGLALDSKLSIKSYLIREIKVTTLLASIIGISLAPIALIGWKNLPVSMVIGVSLFLAIIAAGLSATLLPIFLKKIGADPAIFTGPFATIISDVTTLIIYFLVASLLLVYFA